jgi:hypothetical protein
VRFRLEIARQAVVHEHRFSLAQSSCSTPFGMLAV